VADVATALTPIGDQLRREIVAADYLQTDDTTVTILDERGGSYKGRLWTYLDPLMKQVVFDATPTHERDGPATFLEDFRGKLQADAYVGYDGLYQSGRVIEVGCWAHARRGFVEAFMIDTAAALTIALIQQLYDVERDAADLDPDARRAVRQRGSAVSPDKIVSDRRAPCPDKLPRRGKTVAGTDTDAEARSEGRVGRRGQLTGEIIDGPRRGPSGPRLGPIRGQAQMPEDAFHDARVLDQREQDRA
jgi:hypothetical protein